MDYRLELKAFEQKDGVKYKVLHITDFALHTTKTDPTADIGKKIQRSFNTGRPGRIYTPLRKSYADDSTGQVGFIIDLISQDPNLVDMIRREEANGYKILISLPKGGIPIFAGQDTEEFINGKNGKRLLRGLAKKKTK